MNGQFSTFDEFWPFYLSQHQNRTNRRLHFAGSTLVLILIVLAASRLSPRLLAAAPAAGYGFAWVGHFFFEKNKPATFKYPFYSFVSDWIMYKDMLTGKIRF
jgi:hypothetical protein